MPKNKTISIRISREQHKMIHDSMHTFYEVFNIGYDKIIENSPEKMKKSAVFHHKMYGQCIDKIAKINENVNTMYRQFDDILIWYKKQNRSIDNPTQADIDALELQLKNRKIYNFTHEKVFEYWKNKGNDNESQL